MNSSEENILGSYVPRVLVFLENLFGSNIFFITSILCLFLLKTIIFYLLLRNLPKQRSLRFSYLCLILVLIGTMFEDFAWFSKFFRSIFMPTLDFRILRFIIRVAWIFLPIRFIALILFLENLVDGHFNLDLRKIVFLGINFFYVLFFLYFLVFDINCNAVENVPLIEIVVMRLATVYLQVFFMPVSLWFIYRRMKTVPPPRIIRYQIKILVNALVIPLLIMESIQNFPFDFHISSYGWITNSFTLLGLSNILLVYAIYYCARRMVNVRFLNLGTHVTAPRRFNFIDDFKEVLGVMGQATGMIELSHATQELFQKAFNLPGKLVQLHIRVSSLQEDEQKNTYHAKAITVDELLNGIDDQVLDELVQSQILIYDEIAFNHFYEQNNLCKGLLQFLDRINADIFIPVFNNRRIIGCIIIERNARTHTLYSSIERDEMIVFASYLGNIINLLQNRNLEQLLAHEKEMREELFEKHQEINQYKESIRSFLKNNHHRKIGIIFYRNRQFIFGNREAKELVSINLNMHAGHPMTKTFKQIIADVQQYKSAQKCMASDDSGSKLVIYGIPHLENNSVTIIVYYPEISDLVHKQLELLKDPSRWDYLLYLQTTESGKLVNQLVPGEGEQLLNFKIALLKTALSSKATLLDIPTEDLLPTVELLHHISLRSTLHTIVLECPQSGVEMTMRLFGVNPLFCSPEAVQEPLLKKLDQEGTIFIQNVHFLDSETQECLAEFIRCGFFYCYKSDQKIFSNVRIICSSSQPLTQFVHEGKFSQKLFKELVKTQLVMPSLMSLSEQEIDALAHGYAQQALNGRTYERILELDIRDCQRILSVRPTSLQELKKRVQSLLTQKSRTNNLDAESPFDPGFGVADLDLAEIARLGKHALKDEKSMIILWNKFKNQSKIAAFLGVDRSTVNRRCKKYNLQET